MSIPDKDWSGVFLKKELEAKDPQRTNIVMLRGDTQEIKENVFMWDQRTLFLTVSKKKKNLHLNARLISQHPRLTLIFKITSKSQDHLSCGWETRGWVEVERRMKINFWSNFSLSLIMFIPTVSPKCTQELLPTTKTTIPLTNQISFQQDDLEWGVTALYRL